MRFHSFCQGTSEYGKAQPLSFSGWLEMAKSPSPMYDCYYSACTCTYHRLWGRTPFPPPTSTSRYFIACGMMSVPTTTDPTKLPWRKWGKGCVGYSVDLLPTLTIIDRYSQELNLTDKCIGLLPTIDYATTACKWVYVLAQLLHRILLSWNQQASGVLYRIWSQTCAYVVGLIL